jgi:DNA-binding XRE family transcriptional regulator
VFYHFSLRDDGMMPMRKTKHCPQRKQFGKNIAFLRSRRKLTQERLAEKTGVSARYVQSLEAGEYLPTLPTLARLKSALRCSCNDLFDGCEKA